MFTILILCMFILLMYYLYNKYYINYERNWRLIKLIPGPPGLPIVGNVFQFHVSAEELWKLFYTLHNEYYPIFKVWSFSIFVVSIRHPDDLETILSNTNIKRIEKTVTYDILHPWFGTGLLTSTGVKWQTRRKILTSTFHFYILNQFVDILIKEGDCMTKSLMDIEGTVVKDLLPFISEYTLNAICETAMGVSLQKLGEFQQQYRNAIHDMIELIIYRIFRPWLHNDMIFLLSSQGRKQKKILKILHGFTEKIIAERKFYHERTNGQYLKNLESDKEGATNDVDRLEVLKKKRLAMLDLLIAASQEYSLTDLDIREEVDTFMFEGHDTTATGIMFTLLLLAEHKNIQERVRLEIDNVMQDNGGKLNMRSLQNLSYLDRCLKEALRLYPSVHLIERKLTDDVKLQSYVVPAGTIIRLNIYAVHRDPNFWPNPEVFDPDRFLPEKIENRHPYSYLSFSAGPRNCIGQRFGLLEMKAMIAPLVHNFYLEPIEYLKDIRVKLDMVIRPSHPIHVKFIPITCKQKSFKTNADVTRV
ncbi:cytochrome P450 4C1-like [Camponotus floridanus]|uniref:cytochrome P450 4C1-like n=1 Tax=Camponotus floridanus TaxID=104421 RepID=UPI000DC673D4|nr:cytochrome P450 4C1-like [Camponotus floridanus]